MITLADEYGVGEQHINRCRMLHQIPLIGCLFGQIGETQPGNDHSEVSAQGIERAQITVQVGTDGSAMQHLDVIALQERIHHEFPVHADFHNTGFEVMVVG
jgi:hypothetical protein